MRNTWPCLPLLLALVSCAKEPTNNTTPPPDPCTVNPSSAGCDPRGKPPVYEGNNAIDRVMTRVFWEHEITPVEADTAELCRRMFIDLVGRAPTADQIELTCNGKTAEQIALELQSRDAYLLHSQRHWQDRLNTDDVVTDWRYNKSLYALVDELHQGSLRYDQFAIKVLAHPGFVTTELQPDDRVRAAFRAFMGRPATDAEAADLAGLTRPWIIGQDVDPDFPYIYRFSSYIVPALCQPLLRCSATLFGGAELNLGDMSADFIYYEDLSADQIERLQVFGRVLARQPTFYEAAADAILNRLLGWSDGGRFPREPGILLPEVRQAVAEELRQNGDYPAAERLVLTSWLYRQKVLSAPDGLGDDPNAPQPPVWASGPVKPMTAEDWLDSSFNLAYEFGTCDPRYPDLFAYFLLFDYARTASISQEQLNADIRRLHQLQENRMELYYDEPSGIEYPNTGYSSVARLIGGCPGFDATRSGAEGIAFAFTQEALAELVCQQEAIFGGRPAGAISLEAVLLHQMRQIYGRTPTAEELQIFREAHADCSGDTCSDGGLLSSVCVALLGSAEGLFY